MIPQLPADVRNSRNDYIPTQTGKVVSVLSDWHDTVVILEFSYM